MPISLLVPLVAKAKLAGAAFIGGVIAVAAVGGGAVALHQVADTAPAPLVAVSPTLTDAESPEPTDSESPDATETESPEPTDSESPEATETGSPEPTDSESPDATDPESPNAPESESPTPAGAHVVMNHAKVTSVDGQSLVVTVGAATSTWVLDDLTHYSGYYKNPADLKPGMVVNVQGTKLGDTYTATHVVTPGRNKPSQPKPAKPEREHGKASRTTTEHAKHHGGAHPGKGDGS